MKDKLSHISPREMNNIKELQDGLVLVINLLEQQFALVEDLRKENKSLRDEINILKGEQVSPKFPKPPKTNQPSANTAAPKKKFSGNKNHKKGGRKRNIKIHQTKLIQPDLSILPSDAVLKEYKRLVQQDIRFDNYNTEYQVAIYHSASEGKTYRGSMPEDYQGQFGLGIITLTQLLHHFGDMTQGRLEAVYKSLGVYISAGTISNIITDKGDWALTDQKDILRSGIEHSPYTQLDGTKSIEKGKSMVSQIICSDKFSVFLTMSGKSRLDVLSAIQGKPSDGMRVCYNDYSESFMQQMKVSASARQLIGQLLDRDSPIVLSELEELFDNLGQKISTYNRNRISHALALSYYHGQDDFPVIDYLLSDDAGEYTKIAAKQQALCWIHDVRYYRKLIPRLEVHKNIHKQTLDQYWKYYAKLNAYRKADAEQQQYQKPFLEQEFEILFNRSTDYFQINDCLKRTYANKEKLLAVLENPAIPLHNNAAELGARRVVRKRDISLHTWSKKGTRMRDAYMTVVETAAKLGVNAMSYIKDRISGKLQMTSLADCIALEYQ